MQLRTYQLDLINDLRNSMQQGNKNVLVQSPAGSGKSITMAEIAKRITSHKLRILFVVHRRELVNQIKNTFKNWHVNLNFCDIYMVQTASRRLAKIIRPDYIFVDEAHHSLAKTYLKIFNYFKNAHVIGFTATPWRLSGKGFKSVYDDLVLGPKIDWLIKHHYLSPYTYYSVNLIDQKALKKSSTGDYTQKSIENAGKNIIYGDIIENYKRFANGTKTIIYSYSVQSCKRIAKEFNKNKIPAREVDGKTNKNVRQQSMKDFKSGKIRILVNADLYGEGVDVPDCQTVIMLRPTQSLSLFIQQSMRCMRYQPHKHAIIIDQVTNYTRFGLPDSEYKWTLDDRAKHPQKEGATVDGPAIKTCPECFGVIRAELITCPLCGHDFSAEIREIKQKKEQELHKIKAQQIHIDYISTKKPEELTNMHELSIYAKTRHYKPGWIYHQAKARGWL